MESFEGIIIEILGKKPSSAREIVKELKKDTKKGEVNSVLYSLLKKGVVEKSDTLPPIWSVAQKKTKVLVTIGFQWAPDWLEKAGSLADQHKKVLFFVDRKIRTPKGVENHYLEDITEVSMTTRVVIELTKILYITKDVEIIFSSTNSRWGSMLKQLDETFGMKWTMVSHDWEDVRKHFE
jgi:hypothetical protein